MADMPAYYRVQPYVLLSGRVDFTLSEHVLSAFVEETNDGLCRCEIVLENWQSDRADMNLLENRQRLDFGMDVELRLGAADDNSPAVFQGRVTALEVSFAVAKTPTLTVLAEDQLQSLRMTRRTRTFEEMSFNDIINRIATEHSLTPTISGGTEARDSVSQVNQSDLAFIRRLAGSFGAEVWVRGRELHVEPRKGDAGRPGSRELDIQFDHHLRAFTVRADLAHQCTELLVTGWDVMGKTAIAETAGESVISGELNDGISGPAILKEKFGEHKAQLVHTVPMDTAEARALARAQFAERARRFVVGTGTLTAGDPRLVVGMVINLSGKLAPVFNGKYTVVRTRHTFDRENGFQTEFDVEGPAISR